MIFSLQPFFGAHHHGVKLRPGRGMFPSCVTTPRVVRLSITGLNTSCGNVKQAVAEKSKHQSTSPLQIKDEEDEGVFELS